MSGRGFKNTFSLALRTGASLAALSLLIACNPEIAKHQVPVPHKLVAKMEQLNMDEHAPVLVRIFKEEEELEIWKKRRDGKFALLTSYPICAYSGELGPKKKEGDRQAPEGFYTIKPHLMNPKSSYHLAFNLGYPNAFDQAHGRTGSHLMVHGACSSRGCYAMEDEPIQEIYSMAREAFEGGQRSFQVQAYPFRMTPENMAKHRNNAHMPFWTMLKEGYDHFEITRTEPKIDVCDRRYVFNAQASGAFIPTETCPAYAIPDSLQMALNVKQRKDQEAFQIAAARFERQEQKQEAKQLFAAQEEQERQQKTEQKLAEASQPKQAQSEKLSLLSRIMGRDEQVVTGSTQTESSEKRSGLLGFLPF
jgi:murein L,D-transpeptidase YafK